MIKIPESLHGNGISIHVPITAEYRKSMDTVSSQSLHVNNILHLICTCIYITCDRKADGNSLDDCSNIFTCCEVETKVRYSCLNTNILTF